MDQQLRRSKNIKWTKAPLALTAANLSRALLLCLLGQQSASVLANSSLHGSLAPEHVALAGALAEKTTWTQTRAATSNETHPLGIQTLSIERDEGKKGDTTRRARVYQFNYLTQQSRVVLIDIALKDIEKVQTIDTVHLPLNEVEIKHVRSLIETTPTVMEQLRQTQIKKGLAPLVDLSTIDVKASIYEPDNTEHICSLQRCALVSLFDQTRTVFVVEPVVNLQTSSVSTLTHAH